MKKMKSGAIVFAVALISIISFCTGISYGAGDIGSVVALKGNALIERDARAIEAKLKDGIQLNDTVETRESSKAKMLFIDDSVLTMGEKSKVVIKEFVYSKDKGRSIFNLIDGKMRSVVGKSEFEIHTPTAVAAARGTVFDCETGERSGKQFTACTCYEGVVDIWSSDPTISGRVSLRQGMTVTVISGQSLPAPTPAPATTLRTGGAVLKETTGGTEPGPTPPPIINPPVITPPAKTTTPVNVGIGFPNGSIKVGW